LKADAAAAIPADYFADHDPGRPPINRWRRYAYLLFRNWLDEIYRSRSADGAAAPIMPWLTPQRRQRRSGDRSLRID
jgi:hypothetical protein